MHRGGLGCGNLATMTEKPYLVGRGPGRVEYQLPVSVKLVVDYRGKVPLLMNERDEWELPGGKLEVGESPEQCVVREVAEETGLTLTVSGVDAVDSWVYEIRPDRHVFVVSYGATYVGSEELVCSAEHKTLGLFAYDEVDGLRMPEGYKATIARWWR